MKTIIFAVKNPAKDDLVIVEYSDKRGGCTSVKYLIVGAHQRARVGEGGIVEELVSVPGETPRDVASALAQAIKSGWMAEAFEAGVVESTGALKVHCTGLVQNVDFRCSVAGGGGTTIEMMEL